MGGSLCKKDLKVKVDDKPKVHMIKFIALGLPNAGKSSLIHRLKHGVLPESYITTIGIDFQILFLDGIKLQAWDHASRERSRTISRSYYRGASGVIFMIDSSDTDRVDEAMDYLNQILTDEAVSTLTVMVVANKQDLNNAVGPEVVEEKVKEKCKVNPGITLFVMPMSVVAEDDHSIQLAFRLFVKTMKRIENGTFQTEGFIPRAWETAEEVAADSEVEDEEEESDETKGSEDVVTVKEKEVDLIINPDKKSKSIFEDSIHMFKSILIR